MSKTEFVAKTVLLLLNTSSEFQVSRVKSEISSPTKYRALKELEKIGFAQQSTPRSKKWVAGKELMKFMSENFSNTSSLSELIINMVEISGKTEWEKRKFIRFLIEDLKKVYQISD
ncbi:MAG: hypothetical protein QXS27_00530 [Candidatus Jordarchaeaceae archaeon]